MRKNFSICTAFAVGGLLLLGSAQPAVAAAAWTISTIFTDGGTATYSGVSAISDGRVVTSGDHASLGSILRVWDVSSSSATLVGGSLDIPTGLALNDVAYVGNTGTDEIFYILRDGTVNDIQEYTWNTTTFVGTNVGAVVTYDSAANFQGIDRQFGGGQDNLIAMTTATAFTWDGVNGGASGSATLTGIGYSVAANFTGITAIGDVNSDGTLDYITTRNTGGGLGRINPLISDGVGGFVLGSGFVHPSRSYTGVANLGDPDGDGFLELIVTGSNSAGAGPGTLEYVQTDIVFVPEPASLVLLSLGGLMMIRRRTR